MCSHINSPSVSCRSAHADLPSVAADAERLINRAAVHVSSARPGATALRKCPNCSGRRPVGAILRFARLDSFGGQFRTAPFAQWRTVQCSSAQETHGSSGRIRSVRRALRRRLGAVHALRTASRVGTSAVVRRQCLAALLRNRCSVAELQFQA